jgi:hypothetical protein
MMKLQLRCAEVVIAIQRELSFGKERIIVCT